MQLPPIELSPKEKLMYLTITAYLEQRKDLDDFLKDLKTIYSKPQFYKSRERAIDLHRMIRQQTQKVFK